MYRIIGSDGKEYGPIAAEVLRQWIGEGRANAHTRASAAGSTDWKTLGDFPEFAAALAARATTSSKPPLEGAIDPEAFARDILARDYQLHIGQCFSKGWNLVMANFWFSVGVSLLMFVISAAAGAVPFASLFLNYVFWGGLDWLFLKMARGQNVELSDAFAGFSVAFVPLMLFSVVSSLLTSLGLLLCILPGIYLGVCWLTFTALIIIDKRIDFWPAMELCRKVVTHHWWQVFGFVLLSLLVLLAGLLVCFVGMFIALPVVTAATVYAYEEIFKTPEKPAGLQGLAPVAGAAPAGGPSAS